MKVLRSLICIVPEAANSIQPKKRDLASWTPEKEKKKAVRCCILLDRALAKQLESYNNIIKVYNLEANPGLAPGFRLVFRVANNRFRGICQGK